MAQRIRRRILKTLNALLVERRGITQPPVLRGKIRTLIRHQWDISGNTQSRSREKATPRPKRPPRDEGRRRRTQRSPRTKVSRNSVAERRITRSEDGGPA